MQHCPADIPITILGVGSNLIVRDGGIDGVVIRLGKGFSTCAPGKDNTIIAGAGALSLHAAQTAQAHGLSGLEFLSGIPGTIGGALAMNGGAYGVETADILVEAQAIDPQGTLHHLTPDALGYSYRHSSLPDGWVFTGAILRGTPDDTNAIATRMETIAKERALSQPIRSRTGGSTFKNPPGKKAWELVDAAGCRGLTIGGAQVSQQHCNFLINTGDATAADLETLGEEVRRKVKAHCDITLEWEIKRIGKT